MKINVKKYLEIMHIAQYAHIFFTIVALFLQAIYVVVVEQKSKTKRLIK